jgi:hypothetical protein
MTSALHSDAAKRSVSAPAPPDERVRARFADALINVFINELVKVCHSGQPRLIEASPGLRQE